MFDLGRTIFASAERNARALAIVDGEVRLAYGDWAEIIGRVAGGLRALGLEPAITSSRCCRTAGRWRRSIGHAKSRA